MCVCIIMNMIYHYDCRAVAHGCEVFSPLRSRVQQMYFARAPPLCSKPYQKIQLLVKTDIKTICYIYNITHALSRTSINWCLFVFIEFFHLGRRSTIMLPAWMSRRMPSCKPLPARRSGWWRKNCVATVENDHQLGLDAIDVQLPTILLWVDWDARTTRNLGFRVLVWLSLRKT